MLVISIFREPLKVEDYQLNRVGTKGKYLDGMTTEARPRWHNDDVGKDKPYSQDSEGDPEFLQKVSNKESNDRESHNNYL